MVFHSMPCKFHSCISPPPLEFVLLMYQMNHTAFMVWVIALVMALMSYFQSLCIPSSIPPSHPALESLTPVPVISSIALHVTAHISFSLSLPAYQALPTTLSNPPGCDTWKSFYRRCDYYLTSI